MEHYRTRDKKEAIVLFAADCELDYPMKDAKGIVTFLFMDKYKCESLVNDHYAGRLSANTTRIMEAMDRVNTMLYRK